MHSPLMSVGTLPTGRAAVSVCLPFTVISPAMTTVGDGSERRTKLRLTGMVD